MQQLAIFLFLLVVIPLQTSAKASAKEERKVSAHTKAWLRTDTLVNNPQISPRRNLVAISNPGLTELKVINTTTKDIYIVSRKKINSTYFWSPDGCRLFYMEYKALKNSQKRSNIKSYDCKLKKSIEVKSISGIASQMTFDPRDYRIHYWANNKIESLRVELPDERLHLWKTAMKTTTNKWLVTDKKISLIQRAGFKLVGLNDDKTGISSYSISPDGESIVWATKSGAIYMANSEKSKFIANGIDPSWHPHGKFIIFSKSIFLGKKIRDYDLYVYTTSGSIIPVNTTQKSKERWPNFSTDGKFILYTHTNSTDIYQLSFQM